MATWFDLVAFVAIAAAFFGVMYGAFVVANGISEAVKNTKEQLKSKGVTISDKGVSVKTSSRLTHEDYVDATQRGLINSINKTKGATSFGRIDENGNRSPPTVSRQNSAASEHSLTGSVDEKGKKKGHFSLKK